MEAVMKLADGLTEEQERKLEEIHKKMHPPQ
jgi:hypothetical protein